MKELRKLRTRTFLLLVAFMMLSGGLANAQQVYNFMPGVNFSNFHTYKWVEIPGGIHPNQIVDQEIRQAINTVLAGKGFTLATGDKADLYVGYQCFIQQQRRGMPGVWAEDCGGGAWDRQRVPRSITERWRWIFICRRPKNWCGAAPPPKPCDPAVIKKKTCRS